MSAKLQEVPRFEHTLEEYFAMLQVSERRWEFWDGEFVCMARASPEHYNIAGNLHEELVIRLRGRGCRTYDGETPVNTPSLPPFRFPDLSVVCGKPTFTKFNGIGALNNPLVLFEVLSSSTEYLDREPKREAYQALPSVQEYLLVAQSIPFVTRFVRLGKRWRRIEYRDLNDVIKLTSLDCELLMSEIYRDIEFSES